MATDEIRDLAARVALLERDVGVMKGILWRAGPAPDPAPVPQPPAQPVPGRAPTGPTVSGQAPSRRAVPGHAPSRRPVPGQAWGPQAWTPTPWPEPAPAPVAAPVDEAALAGTWFARGGALAVLVGAGFAFKYGIDHGLITETARVIIGLLAGLAFVAWGYWARRRGWATFSQAVTAGGIGLCYLSVTVAAVGYHLVSGAVGFAGLVAITAGSAALAWWYDSPALAILATVGGFLNPFLAWQGGRPQPAALDAYLLILDAGVLGLAFLKDWRPLDAIARAGTWLLFGIGLSTSGFASAEAFATTFLLLFVLVPVLASIAPARRGGRPSDESDVVMLAFTGLADFGFSSFLLWHHQHGDLQGAFTFGLAAGFAALAGLTRVIAPKDRLMRLGLLGLAALAATIAVPLQVHGLAIALAWAGGGVALTYAGMHARSVPFRTFGAVILGAGALVALGVLFNHYGPAHLLVSPGSASLLGVIAALAAEAFLFSRDADPDSRRVWFPLSAVAANGLAIAWLSAEAIAHYRAGFDAAGWQPLQFTLSAIWAGYAGVLLATGVGTRQRWARLAALALFGLTVLKMAMIDLWTLSTGERVLAFIGVGAVLLACSLLYHRFRELIFAPEGAAAPAAKGW